MKDAMRELNYTMLFCIVYPAIMIFAVTSFRLIMKGLTVSELQTLKKNFKVTACTILIANAVSGLIAACLK